MKKRILFLSSVNLTTNPRILKEIKLAVSLGYSVSFTGFYLSNWSDELEKKHIDELKENVNFTYLSASRKPFLPWFISSVIEFVAKKIYFLFPESLIINSLASNKRSYLLSKWLKNNKPEADIIIAHTLACLFPAYKYAQSIQKPFAFDVEDYHPGEKIWVDEKNEKMRRVFLMKNILPAAKYISCASPLIEQEVKQTILNNDFTVEILTINNNFSQQEFVTPVSGNRIDDKLKLVWFSQNISFGRGLEETLPILSKFQDFVSVDIIGQIQKDIYDTLICKYLSFVNLIEPINQKSLHIKLSTYDIGLALESNRVDLNKRIALSNKILAYYQAGLYILASDTIAQENFLGQHQCHGIVASFESKQFENAIKQILSNKRRILFEKEKRFYAASNFNWENESEKLKQKWQS